MVTPSTDPAGNVLPRKSSSGLAGSGVLGSRITRLLVPLSRAAYRSPSASLATPRGSPSGTLQGDLLGLLAPLLTTRWVLGSDTQTRPPLSSATPGPQR